MQILVIEDERKMANLLRQCLTEEGHHILLAHDGREGLELARTPGLDVLVLDLILPGLAGLNIAQTLRDEGIRVPILILTARDADEDVVRGLNAGADDYLTKPFSIEVLLARIRALARRGPVSSGHLSNHGPGDRYVEAVWGVGADISANNLEAFVHLLRSKVEYPGGSKLIHTVRGVGYAALGLHMKFGSIRLRLAAWYLLVLGAGVVLFAVAIFVTLRYELMEGVHESLSARLHSFALFLELESRGADDAALREEAREYSTGLPSGHSLRVRTADGSVLFALPAEPDESGRDLYWISEQVRHSAHAVDCGPADLQLAGTVERCPPASGSVSHRVLPCFVRYRRRVADDGGPVIEAREAQRS